MPTYDASPPPAGPGQPTGGPGRATGPGQPTGGTVYGRSTTDRPRPDRTIRISLAVAAGGVLVGLLFATGVLSGGGPDDSAQWADGPVRPAGAAAGSDVPAPTTPAPTVAASPTATPPATLGPDQLRIFRSTASALCLDLAPGEDPEGADLLQAACTGAPAQQWQPTPVGGDAFTLTNVASGKCLDVDNFSVDDGAPIQQWSCNGGENQHWRFAQEAGAVALVNVHSGKCVALADPNAGTGTKVHQFGCDGTATQRWAEQPPA
ncbi:RICIN domain-containing protein [Solwaraspora sp. WMMD1047]|uniref:RICIN domain-containing protein n=1 Tax=Solwaraspora sp. WMMD1047 TaxID=3016102 RepID=UPI002415F969|nr:RICIN domain-containing protein [Solwaraspora sp. WMMD1047]MDG4832878.1 RICIN domain-containing protein [Solwaraspora sp. WMMD1047]